MAQCLEYPTNVTEVISWIHTSNPEILSAVPHLLPSNHHYNAIFYFITVMKTQSWRRLSQNRSLSCRMMEYKQNIMENFHLSLLKINRSKPQIDSMHVWGFGRVVQRPLIAFPGLLGFAGQVVKVAHQTPRVGILKQKRNFEREWFKERTVTFVFQTPSQGWPVKLILSPFHYSHFPLFTAALRNRKGINTKKLYANIWSLFLCSKKPIWPLWRHVKDNQRGMTSSYFVIDV